MRTVILLPTSTCIKNACVKAGSRVRGWTATALLVWVCARLLGSRPRVDWITLFSSPEPGCRHRLGRASQVRDGQPTVPKLHRRDGARPLLPRSRPNERILATRAGARHELGEKGLKEQSQRDDAQKGSRDSYFFFSSLGSV